VAERHRAQGPHQIGDREPAQRQQQRAAAAAVKHPRKDRRDVEVEREIIPFDDGRKGRHGERAPTLAGVYGRHVQLADGSTIVADEEYLRESILNPGAKIVAGFEPIMPIFQGQVDEEGVLALIAYIRSLAQQQHGEPVANRPPPANAPPAGRKVE